MGKTTPIVCNKNAGTGSGISANRESTGSLVLSLFALYARSSFYKILMVLAGLVLAEGISFYAVCRGLGQRGETLYPEAVPDRCLLKFFFLAAMAAVHFILAVTEDDRGGCKSSYTLRRLKISQKQQFAVRAAYNFLCLATVSAVQILAAFTICRLYEAKLPLGLVSPQYLFLVFYRNDFLHRILPMADAGGWMCNFLLLLALAMNAAGGRRGWARNGTGGAKNAMWGSAGIYFILTQWFVYETGSFVAVLLVLFSVGIIAAALLRLFGVTGGGDGEEA